MALFDIKKIQYEAQSKKAEDPIIAKINQRRRQLLIHSYLYYKLDDTLIDDATYDRFAHELKDLVTKYPDKAKQAVLSEEFKEWDNEPKLFSGYGLPYNLPWVARKAMQLLRYKANEDRKNGKEID